MAHHIRNALYFELLASLRIGESVVVSGSRLSGRSSVLYRLSLEANARLRPALVVNPISREAGPLESIRYALAERDYEPGPTRSNLLVMLRRHLEESDGPIVIDDAQRLDTESLMAIEQASRRTGRPVVIATSTTQARLRREGSTLFPDAVQLALAPIGMEGATALIADVLDGAPDTGTTALILSKSGGIPGIIVALARDGQRSGALYEKNGVWTSRRHNWTSGAMRTVLSLIDDLDDNEIEALTRLSLLGRIDGDTAAKVMAPETLAVLERRGFLFRENLADDLARVRISVYPELLAEQLRDQTGLFQRQNLLAPLRMTLSQRYPDGENSDGVEPTDMMAGDTSGAMADAYLAATIRQNTSAQLLVRSEQWQQHRSLRDAIELLDLLVARGASGEEVSRVLDEAHALKPRSDEELTAFATWEARWFGWLGGDPQKAIAMLNAVQAEVNMDSRRALAAAAHHMESTTGLSSERDTTWPLNWAAEHPALIDSLELIARGRFTEALDSIQTGPYPSQATGNIAAYFRGFSMLMLGDIEEALAFSNSNLSDALARRDPSGIVLMTNVYALACVSRGDLREAERALGEALAVGFVSFPQVFAQVSNLVLLSVLKARLDQRRRAITTYRQAASLGIRYGYMPFCSPELAVIFMDRIDEKPEAEEQLWSICVELLDRGYDLAALSAWILGGPWSSERNALIAETIKRQEGTFSPPLLRLHEAMTANTPEKLESSYAELLGLGRGFYAALAANQRSQLAPEGHQDYTAWIVKADSAAATVGLNIFDVTRFATKIARLSEREREIFDLVAMGESNQAIADRLFISVRTVENHVLRALKKLELRSRREIPERWSKRPH